MVFHVHIQEAAPLVVVQTTPASAACDFWLVFSGMCDLDCCVYSMDSTSECYNRMHLQAN